MTAALVTREGSRLLLDGRPFRFSGANIYWLGLDENVGGIAYPTTFRIEDAIDTARDLGVTVIRSHLATSTSQGGANPLAVMPAIDEWNDAAFDSIDHALAYGGDGGMRFILPLTDEWAYYHGGHRDFTAPFGLEPDEFFTDRRAIDAFRRYVERFVTHTNRETGTRYADDPAILAWELGNELEHLTPEWVDELATLLRHAAPSTLVAAGRRFGVDDASLTAPGIDLVDVHYYPPTAEGVAADARRVVEAGKVYLAGEYGSVSASPELLDPLAADPNVTGMCFWSLFGRDDGGRFVEHDDGFTLHVPGDTSAMRANVAAIRAFGTALAGAAA
ncbi:cellulase family glycosylhydrolase [Agromyces intestinalis]|uniref:mannan endo-1,4-beta-mannosidase n=1 Tax=Agromyces intestinalis TaxID=2592652 RepID=A0A5C1YFI3_9MICO|nr:cellulase family glycosylhydrolase [Agromyces intestinalis]QEO14438.1 cellulase family glycosylhydrolase [Agromyces intestinalis]